MFNFGKAQATLQQFDCSTTDFDNLLKQLPESDNPFLNWKSKEKINKIKASKAKSWFPKSKRHAVFHSFGSGEGTAGNTPPLTYADLHKCIDLCPAYDTDDNITVAVVLPSTMMAEMAVVLVSLLAQPNVCIAPLDSSMSTVKLREALKQLKCQGIVTTADFFAKMEFMGRECKFHDIRVIESTGEAVGAVQWKVLHQEAIKFVDGDSNKDEKPVIVLRTSGTTSLPKVVPLTASSLLYNATCIASSLRLQRSDVGCNVMPLFHIGGVSCALLAVLVSGSSVVMMGQFEPELFLDCVSSTEMSSTKPSTPTWYYGVPSMHKTLVLTAQARLQLEGRNYIPNQLRFIRSGAAHLPHETALELSKVFRTAVYPTYSMSEAMPICSYHAAPVVWNDNANDNMPNAVGHPIGCNLKIVNELGNALPYGIVGEVALSGPGVMKTYSGLVQSQTHTPDGFLRTGDIGELDKNGVLTLKGRLKEMIKRGGEQVWPNEVDCIVEQVSGVANAVTFGVPNDLWGEEVAVAVVLDKNGVSVERANMERSIMDECRKQLQQSAVPAQIIFLQSTGDLLKGPTGKYLRAQLAEHLHAKPVDTGALRVLEARVHTKPDEESSSKKILNPSSALNGVRLIAAYFVVQTHVGLYPNSEWLRIQSFTLDMPIFFVLGGFQLACSIKDSVWQSWGQWVGTKIGTMHALFVVTQIIGLPSYLLFHCGEDGYQEQFADSSCKESMASFIPLFVLQTATGMFPRYDSVNPPAWFQTAFYMFLMMFPPLDAHLRNLPAGGLAWRLALNLAIASVFFVFINNFLLEYLVVGWLPTLVSAMIAGYFFSRYAVDDAEDATSCFQNPRLQGVIADLLSLAFLSFEVIVALSPSCFYVEADDFLVMRPGEPLPSDTITIGEDEFVNTCDLTYDEFIEYVHENEMNLYNGRMFTEFGMIVGGGRAGTPLVLLWLYALAHGRGLTARFMNFAPLQWLAPLAYPLYLLHVSVARYYWVATRGLEAEHWFADASGFPVPVEWYETFIIVAISLVLGFILDRTVVPFLTRYTVSFGVSVCRTVERRICCCRKPANLSALATSSSSQFQSNLDRVEDLIKRMTGNSQISQSTGLRDLGLDSLGATALLGTLRASVPAARKLTLQQLVGFETVGDLVEALNAVDQTEETKGDDSDVATESPDV